MGMMTYTHDDTMNLSSSHNQGYMYLNRLPHGSQTILIPHDEQISLSKLSGDPPILQNSPIISPVLKTATEERPFSNKPDLILEKVLPFQADSSQQQLLREHHLRSNLEAPGYKLLGNSQSAEEETKNLNNHSMPYSSSGGAALVPSKMEKSKESRNTNSISEMRKEHINHHQQDWKALNVGIFSIQMTAEGAGQDMAKTGGSQGKTAGASQIIAAQNVNMSSRTPPFAGGNSSKSGQIGLQRPRSGSTIHFNQKRPMTPGQENNLSYDAAINLKPEVVPLQATPNRSSIRMNESQGSRVSKSIEIIQVRQPNYLQDGFLKNEISGTGGLDSTPSRVLLKPNGYGDSIASIHLQTNQTGNQAQKSNFGASNLLSKTMPPKRATPVLTVAAPAHPRPSKLQSPVSTLNNDQQQNHLATQRSGTDGGAGHQISQIGAQNNKDLIPTFGIQVYNHNKQKVVNQKPKKRRLVNQKNTCQPLVRGLTGVNREKSSRLGSASNSQGRKQKIQHSLTVKKAQKQVLEPPYLHKNSPPPQDLLDVNTKDNIINVISQQPSRHRNNDGLNMHGRRESQGGMGGLFESAGTQESNQQRINYFDNRYNPDEELEMGNNLIKASPKQPVQGLKLHQDSSSAIFNAQNSGNLNSFIQPMYQGEDGTRTRYFIPMLGNQSSSDVEKLMAAANEINQGDQSSQKQPMRQYIKIVHSKEQSDPAGSSSNGDISIRNQQQQVSLMEITQDDWAQFLQAHHSLMNNNGISLPHLMESYALSGSYSNLNLNAIVESFNKINSGQNQVVLNKDRSLSNNSSSLQGFGLSIEEQINALIQSHQPITPKTLQQFIQAKKDEQVVQRMDPSKTNGPYSTIHLRKQEDEERQKSHLETLRVREQQRGNMMVQGVNIRTITQKIAEANQIISHSGGFIEYGTQKVNAGVNSDIFSQSGLDSRRTHGLGFGDSNTFSDRNHDLGVVQLPQTLLMNKYNNSQPAIVGNLAQELSHRQVIYARNSAELNLPKVQNIKSFQNRRQTEEGNTLLRNESSINPIQNLLQQSEKRDSISQQQVIQEKSTPLKILNYYANADQGSIMVDHQSLSPRTSQNKTIVNSQINFTNDGQLAKKLTLNSVTPLKTELNYSSIQIKSHLAYRQNTQSPRHDNADLDLDDRQNFILLKEHHDEEDNDDYVTLTQEKPQQKPLNRQELSDALISLNESERLGDNTQRGQPPQVIEKISLKMGDSGEQFVQYNTQENVMSSNAMSLEGLEIKNKKESAVILESSVRESIPQDDDRLKVPAQLILEEGRKNAASKISGAGRPKTAFLSPTPKITEQNPINIIQTIKDHNDKQLLAKSYSKMMQQIGLDLKNIGPFSQKSKHPTLTQGEIQSAIQRKSNSPNRDRVQTQGLPGKRPRLDQENQANNNIPQDSVAEGIKEIIGTSVQRQTRTGNAQRGEPGKTYTRLPSPTQMALTQTQSIGNQNNPALVSQGSRLKSATNLSNKESVLRPASAAEFKARIMGVHGLAPSEYSLANIVNHKQSEKSIQIQSKTFHRPSATWTQWPTTQNNTNQLNQKRGIQLEEDEKTSVMPSQIVSSLSRANIIVENFNKIQNTQRLFISGHNNSSFSQQTANAQALGFINRNRKLIAQTAKAGSPYSRHAKRNPSGNSVIPSQMAAYEGILSAADSNAQITKSNNQYEGVFSAKTFEILVPHNQDQLMRLGNAAQFGHLHSQPKLLNQSRPVTRGETLSHGGISNFGGVISNNSMVPLQSQTVKNSPKKLISHTRAASMRESTFSTNQIVPQIVPQNKLKVFQKLKKGTVFKDEDFQAKRPDVQNGIKVTNRY